MHETGIAYHVVEIVIQAAKENNATSVRAVRIQAGRLRGIVPEQLQMAWRFVTRGTIADRSHLCVETIPVEALCEVCQKTFPVHDLRFRCPLCGGDRVQTVRGLELQVKDVELAF